ncbi:hypothetical protein RJ639_032481 [Escallonia herrerae]|uniref:Glucan endo-1,3-beta-D-glucosidase n=1 Tax=Escallonia herrerae TaxID=1293975 RepID=A0AA88WVK3_9ASTE|nr:hypothetical protein RJ639_032481 [Escallonia herrerae]
MAYARLSLLSIMIIVIYGHIGTMEASNDIGVCYGMMGNNLPSPSDVVTLYKKYGIGKIRLFDPNRTALKALRGSQIDVSLNQCIPSIASNQEFHGTCHEKWDTKEGLTDLELVVSGPVVVDGSLSYQYLFDLIVDSFFWAMEKEGLTDVELVVSESGWPSAGNGNLTTPVLAATCNKNFMEHVMKNGTPKRPNSYIEGFIFAMFNENLKPDGVGAKFWTFFILPGILFTPYFLSSENVLNLGRVILSPQPRL